MFRASFRNWLFWAVVGIVAYLPVNVLMSRMVRGWTTYNWPDFLWSQLVLQCVWWFFTRAERARGRNRRKAEVEAANEESRRRSDEEKRRRERWEKAYELVFALTHNQWYAEGGPADSIDVLYLNPAGALREMRAEKFRKYEFPLEDHPHTWVVRTGYTSFDDQHNPIFKYGVCIGGRSSINLWYIRWHRDNDIVLSDLTSDEVPLGIDWKEEDTVEDSRKRIERVLQFVTKYSSVADYTLKTIMEYGVPVLRKGRQSGQRSPQLARLRIALQLGCGMFPAGKPFAIEDLDERDPDRA